MARVLALVPDLMFGSRVQAALAAAGHDVELLAGDGQVRQRLADSSQPAAGALVVDLTSDHLQRCRLRETLSDEGLLRGVRTLAFYSHVEVHVRERAERAGFDVVAPRSRMAREGAALLARMTASG